VKVTMLWGVVFVLALNLFRSEGTEAAFDDPLLNFIAQQASRTATTISPTAYPEATSSSSSSLNTWITCAAGCWTCGFFPGQLWYLYNLTGDSTWKDHASTWTNGISGQQYNTGTHDVGFMVFDSFGKGYELGGMTSYKSVILNAAQSLSTRFNPTVGCIQSWGAGNHCVYDPNVKTNYPVIIDNMMNLELLFWAAANGGSSNFYNIAVTHADTTLKNHIRSDGSTYHVVDYVPSNGAINIRCSAQGYFDESTWARGQAWCVYGFTMTYRYTKLSRHLQAAQTCADVYVKHLQSDNIPLWDFDWDGDTGYHYRDTSSAAIAASGLLELATFSDSSKPYHTVAENIIAALNSTAYLGTYDKTEGVELHSIGNYPANGQIDVDLIYTDYYLLEAIRRLRYGWF